MSTHILAAIQHTLGIDQLSELDGYFIKGDVVIHKIQDHPLFDKLSNTSGNMAECRQLAREFATSLVKDGEWLYTAVILPIGSPMFQIILDRALRVVEDDICEDIIRIYAHSERISEDQVQPDGTVKKVSVFKHSHFNYLY